MEARGAASLKRAATRTWPCAPGAVTPPPRRNPHGGSERAPAPLPDRNTRVSAPRAPVPPPPRRNPHGRAARAAVPPSPRRNPHGGSERAPAPLPDRNTRVSAPRAPVPLPRRNPHGSAPRAAVPGPVPGPFPGPAGMRMEVRRERAPCPSPRRQHPAAPEPAGLRIAKTGTRARPEDRHPRPIPCHRRTRVRRPAPGRPWGGAVQGRLERSFARDHRGPSEAHDGGRLRQPCPPPPLRPSPR
jgi:hypothetical protein